MDARYGGFAKRTGHQSSFLGRTTQVMLTVEETVYSGVDAVTRRCREPHSSTIVPHCAAGSRDWIYDITIRTT